MKHPRRTPLLLLTFALACGPQMGATSDGDASSEGGSSAASVDATEGPGGTSSSGDDSTTAGSTSPMTTTPTTLTTGLSATDPGDTVGCEFVCDADEPSPVLECDIFVQDCPEGQKCAGYDSDQDGAWDSAKCVDLVGDDQLDDPCTAEPGLTGIDSCDVGLICWNLDEEGDGLCHALCTGSPDSPMCPDGSTCTTCQTCVIPICLGGCDPLLQDCPGNDLCIGDLNNSGFVCVLDASGGMAPEGSPCEFANVCNPGTMCANLDLYPGPDCVGSLGCCAPFCEVGDPGGCEGLSVEDAECVPYYADGEAPPGYELVGVCGVME